MKKTEKNILRVLALLLAAIMAVAVLASCGKSGNNNGEGSEEMKEGGLEGFTLNVLSTEHYYTDTPGTLMYTEEANGDTIREAVDARNNNVKKKYGLEITQTYIDKTASVVDEIVKLTAAQDDAYQVCTANGSSCVPFISQNLFNNVFDLPYLKLENDYWYGDKMELLSVNGFGLGLIGDIIFDTYESMLLTMYNTPLARDFAIDDLYEVTNKGGWTYTRMMSEMEKVITDLDNDGRYGYNDRLGLLYASNNLLPYVYSADVTFCLKDKEGEFYYDTSVNERAEQICEEAIKLIHTKGYAADWLSSTDAFTTIVGMIENKNVLFQNMVISQVRRFYREIKTDFGLLPLPKLDEEQEKYCTAGDGQVIIVPSSNLDLDKTGFALEALGQYSSDYPNIYFHVCLESKFTRDAESIDMIMLCYRNIITDPLAYYDFGGFASAVNVVIASNRSFSTVYTNLADSIEESIVDVMSIEIG